MISVQAVKGYRISEQVHSAQQVPDPNLDIQSLFDLQGNEGLSTHDAVIESGADGFYPNSLF